MRSRHARPRSLLLLLLVGMAVCASGTSWAQEAPPSDAVTRTIYSGSPVVAGVGAVVGSVVFAPFKALIMCPANAVAAGVESGGGLESVDDAAAGHRAPRIGAAAPAVDA